jgi:AcrR family transcriptional regulator
VEASAEQNVATIKRNVTRIVEGEGTAMERLEASIFSVYRFHKELLQNERQIFKLVASAIEEDWSCIQEFDAFMRCTLERLVIEGIDLGEFRPTEPRATAAALLDCLSLALHPHIRNAVVHDGSEERVHAQIQLLAKALK